jgi:DNA-binding transcriptional LysR family regulator
MRVDLTGSGNGRYSSSAAPRAARPSKTPIPVASLRRILPTRLIVPRDMFMLVTIERDDVSCLLPLLNGVVTTMNLSNIDLDLFVVLHAVLTERSATRAAARLHITRPAVSNALARLRLVLNDPLVVRSARGLVPTPRAMEIAPMVASALEQISAVVAQTATFDASTTTRRFTIACSDSEQISILPAVFGEFRRRLPAASLRVAGIDQMLATGGLSSGEVDVMIGTMPTAPAGLRIDLLLTDHFVCIARIRHPSLHRKLTSAQFGRCRTLTSLSSPIDRPSAADSRR